MTKYSMSKAIAWVALLLFSFTWAEAQTVKLNEIQTSNSATVANSYGTYDDWVELFNATGSPIDLTGYYLSDAADIPLKWQFPSGTIAANGRLMIWASDRNLITVSGEIHTNFKISNGETILLSDPSGIIVDQISPPSLLQNNSYGRMIDGDEVWAHFVVPTPNLANQTQTGYLSFLDQPGVNIPAGFYADPFQISLNTTDPEATIYYTLDCSVPTPGSPTTFIYDPLNPIQITDRSVLPNDFSTLRTTLPQTVPANWIYNWNLPTGLINKASIVRAKTVKAGALDSPIQNLTYFVGSQFTTQYQGIPVVSLITAQENFFGAFTGIYIPGTTATGVPNTTSATANYSQDWERPIYIQMWEPDRVNGFNTNAIAQIHGSASANLMRKGLRVEFKSSVGITALTYDLFGDGAEDTYDAFLLRASGQDVQHMLFRDGVGQSFFKDQNLSISPYRPAIVFIDGEYWGIHNLRERSNEEYVSRIHSVSTTQMDFLENRGVANPDEVVGTRTYYTTLLNYVRNNDLSVQANFDALCQMIDIENYTKYSIAETFVANSDWPSYNVRLWRYKPELTTPNVFFQENPAHPDSDGRFRWLIFDFDQALGRFQSYTANTIQNASVIGSWNDNFFVLFRKLIGASDANGNALTDGLYNAGSPQFRNKFINYYCDALNTYLAPTRTNALVDAAKLKYQPYMPEHIARWTYPATVSDWNGYVNGVKTFLNNRPTYIRTQLTNKFHLSAGTANLTTTTNHADYGYIKLNSLNLGSNNGFEPMPFTGIYFKDIPVSIKAVANPGYRFIGWSGISSTADSVLVTLTSDLTITALFDVNEVEFPGDTMNPAPWNLNSGPYCFNAWSSTNAAGSYPPNMRFLKTATQDPALSVEMVAPYTGAYNLTSGARIEGMNGRGISFINTSSSGFLGAAVLGLKTTGLSGIKVNFIAETVLRNTRLYGLMLQYRIGTEGSFTNVTQNGNDVKYLAVSDGHKQSFFAIALPAAVDNQPYVQLRWKYYYISGGSSNRPQLRIDDILVYTDLPAVNNVYINEVMSSNVAWVSPYASDDKGIRSDWIELYNKNPYPLNLLGCYLSDDVTLPGKWMLPSITIPAEGFLLARASDSDVQNPTLPLHTNFQISSTGEAILLSSPSGILLSQSPATAIPVDQTLALLPDGSENWQIVTEPTPNALNILLTSPGGVLIQAQSPDLMLHWDSVTFATSYDVYSADAPNTSVWTLEGNTISTSWLISPLQSHRFFFIKAVR